MIDFHTHILPNIDNGSRNINETFELIEEAKKKIPNSFYPSLYGRILWNRCCRKRNMA